MNTQILVYLSRILTMLLVLPLHEAAHGLVAKWMGDDTALYQGRITLNPFKHLDPLGSLLMLFTGFGWAKPVPINPLRMKSYRGGVALTALAGPVSNLLAALVSAIIYQLIPVTGTTVYLAYIFFYLVYINVGLAVFNLIPVPPLDGFNVLRYFTSEKVDRWFYMHQREFSIGFLVIILIITRSDKFNFLGIISGKIAQGIFSLVSFIPEIPVG